jgi:zinc protease
MIKGSEMMLKTAQDGLSRALSIVVLALAFVTFPVVLAARADVDIQEVTSESGITAWLVEDYTVPVINIRFAFTGGSVQEPEGKEGLANLMTGLFDEGAGDLESAVFQERMDDAGGEMSFSATRDAVFGSLRMLAEDREEVLDLLRLAVTEPRFDEVPFERIRAQILTGLQSRERDPEHQGRLAFARALYGDHPYGRSDEGTSETLAALTPDDVRALHERLFARSNLHVAVVGAIDAETLAQVLDEVFGDLPAEADLVEIDPVEPALAQEVGFEFALPQSSLQLVYPGLARDDEAFFPAFLMNHVLGGGSFSSRLFNEVREARGLTYGIGSWLRTDDYTNSLNIATSTRSDRVSEALEVIEAEIARMIEEGPTEQELADAKRYLIGAYAINNLDTSASVARTLVELQRNDLGIDYISRREELINEVTREQAHEAARRLLSAEPALMVIGPARTDTAEPG